MITEYFVDNDFLEVHSIDLYVFSFQRNAYKSTQFYSEEEEKRFVHCTQFFYKNEWYVRSMCVLGHQKVRE